MKGKLSIRTSTLVMVMVMALMAILSACDSTPATPIPTPAPTATTVQAVAPTATQAVVIAPTVQATKAAGGKLNVAKSGNIKEMTRSAPKGGMATRSINVAKGDAPFEEVNPARATVTQPPDEATATVGPSTPGGVPEDWTVILDSDFSENDPGTWLTGDAGDFGASVEDGTYNMTAKDGAGFYTWSAETENWGDGYISATLKIEGTGIVAVAARVSRPDENFNDVICAIANTGKYGCYVEVDGKDTTIASAASSLIKKNGTNTIALLAIGADYTFFINGKSVKTFSNDSLVDGAFGMYLGSNTGTTTGKFSKVLFMGPGEVIEATPTAEPDEDVTPTEVVVDEPTEVVVEETATPGSGDETVIVSTDFTEDAGTWYTGEGDGFSVDVSNGELRIEASNPGGVVATISDETLDLADARIEATLRVEDTSKSDPGFVGVSARSQEFATEFEDWAQIFCGINNSSMYSCNRVETASDGSLEFTELLHGKTSSIKANKKNTIALTGKGNRWTFEVNGTKVGSFTDNSVETGAWGVLVRAGDKPTVGYFAKLVVSER